MVSSNKIRLIKFHDQKQSFSEDHETTKINKMVIKTKLGTAYLYRLNEKRKNSQPILFIHGFNSSNKIWYSYSKNKINYEGFAEKALEDGYDVWTLQLSKPKMANLQELADEDLFEAIRIIFKHTNKRIKLIAHSMGGVLCRCLTDPDKFKNSNKENINVMISEICTLATPHLGFSIKRKKKFKIITKILSKFENWVVKQRKSRFYNGFFQFLSGSDLFAQLSYGTLLNPTIKWRNAIAMHDVFIYEASFLPEYLLNQGYLEQKIFGVHHFKLPYVDIVNKWISKNKIQKRLKFFENTIDVLKQPPIYRSVEVYDWIFNKRKLILN